MPGFWRQGVRVSALLTDLEALRRAILIDPADDLARLVFADAAEEDGQPDRAELVRVQIAIAEAEVRCNCNTCVERRGGGQRHNGACAVRRLRWGDGGSLQAICLEAVLLSGRFYDPPPGYTAPGSRVHGRYAWAGVPLASLPDPDHKGWTFRRGFVSEVSLPLAAFMQHAEAIFNAHPITAVSLTDRKCNTATAKPGWLVAHPNWCNPDGSLKEGAGGHWLPGCLVPPGAVNRGTALGGGFCYFDTPQEADAALSGWCVACGRDKAGLPPLGAA
jgi:uncharacterized protein (TIGR02996 family)